ncbi:TPA: hypothetical protein ACH3X2_004429 [Trebouxia sp. C0005]
MMQSPTSCAENLERFGSQSIRAMSSCCTCGCACCAVLAGWIMWTWHVSVAQFCAFSIHSLDSCLAGAHATYEQARILPASHDLLQQRPSCVAAQGLPARLF